MRLPPFRVVGDSLKDRYDGASRIMVSNVGNNRNPNNAHSNKNKKVNRKKLPKCSYRNDDVTTSIFSFKKSI